MYCSQFLFFTNYYLDDKRKMRWVENAARMGENKNVMKPEGRDHLEDLGVDVRKVLKLKLKN